MRQLADRTIIIPKQKTPRGAERSQASSGSRMASWSARLCLPLLSENKRVLWIHADEANMQPDGEAELIKAFGQCPYLTQNQTAALAQRCSLHPDQVKVWFMAQRLRYGISWDRKDIAEICDKLKSDHEDEEFREGVKDDQKKDKAIRARRAAIPRRRRKRDDRRIPDRAEKLGAKGETTEMEGQTLSTCEGGDLTEKKSRGNTEQIFSPVKNAQDNLLEVPLVAISSVLLRPQTDTSTATVVPESQADLQDRTLTPAKSNVEGETEALASVEEALPAGATEQKNVVTDVEELKKLVKPEHSLPPANSPTVGPEKEETRRAPHTRTRIKTESQLSMLRRVFLQYQFADDKQYNSLVSLVGLRRCHLVQWFKDQRYAVKRSKPRWMTEEQYQEVLANIKDQQREARRLYDLRCKAKRVGNC